MLNDKLKTSRMASILLAATLLLANLGTVIADDYPDFPFSKKMNVVIAANSIEYNGIPTQIFQFDTELSLDELTDYYEDQWSDLNKVDAGDRRILSHREGDYLQTVQIELSNHPTTHGILVSSPVFKLLDQSDTKIKKLRKAIGDGFPSLPNTIFISDIRGEEVAGDSRSLLFLNDYGIRRNIEFYSTKMSAEGWVSINQKGLDANPSVLAMNKGGRKFNLSFSRKDDKTHGVAVFLP